MRLLLVWGLAYRLLLEKGKHVKRLLDRWHLLFQVSLVVHEVLLKVLVLAGDDAHGVVVCGEVRECGGFGRARARAHTPVEFMKCWQNHVNGMPHFSHKLAYILLLKAQTKPNK